MPNFIKPFPIHLINPCYRSKYPTSGNLPSSADTANGATKLTQASNKRNLYYVEIFILTN